MSDSVRIDSTGYTFLKNMLQGSMMNAESLINLSSIKAKCGKSTGAAMAPQQVARAPLSISNDLCL